MSKARTHIEAYIESPTAIDRDGLGAEVSIDINFDFDEVKSALANLNVAYNDAVRQLNAVEGITHAEA